MGPIWGFPSETCGQSRRSASVCGKILNERRMETHQKQLFLHAFNLSLMAITTIACITAAFERHLQFWGRYISVINLFIAVSQPQGLVDIFFNKALTSVCGDCPLSIISHKWGPETRSVHVCVCVCHCVCKWHMQSGCNFWLHAINAAGIQEWNEHISSSHWAVSHPHAVVPVCSVLFTRVHWLFPWCWIRIHFLLHQIHVTCHQQVIWNMQSLYYMLDSISSFFHPPFFCCCFLPL